MNIKRLQIENFLRVSVVDIRPDGNVIYITGKNTHGKTSVLNAIWAGLANPRFSEFPKPVKDGEEKAIITIDLDQYVITRIFTDIGGDTKTTLKVEGAEGAVFLKPQKFLDKLLGALTFDPLAFIDMKEKPQVEMLLKLAGGEIDIEAMDVARGNAYDQRTTANQTVKTLSAARGEEPEKLEKIDLSKIQNDMELSTQLRSDISDQRTKKLNKEAIIANLNDEIIDLEKEIVTINNYLIKADETIRKYKPYDELKADIEKGIEHNIKVGDWNKWNQAGEDLKLYSDKANEYTNAINDIDARKKKAIADLEFPYPGLSFGAGGVVFNNIPLKQASKAEQIRISMAIAMAMNPKLRVLRIEDGSLLDEDNLKLIHDLAEAKDYQVWIERVKGDGVGILIEDGTVKDAV